MRTFKTLGETIKAAKLENPKNLKLILLGYEGNGFELVLMGSDFGSIVKDRLKLLELNDVIQSFGNYLEENGIIMPNNSVGLDDMSILANASHDRDCAQIVKAWSKKERNRVQKSLKQYQQKMHSL